MQRYICNRAAGVCKKKPPPLTKQRKHDEKFQAMSVRTARLWRKFGAQFSRRNSARSSARNSHGAILTTPTGGREADAGHAGEPEGDGDVWYHVPPRGPRGDDGQDEGHGACPRRATAAQFSAGSSAQFSEQRSLPRCSSPRATRRWEWTARRWWVRAAWRRRRPMRARSTTRTTRRTRCRGASERSGREAG